MRITTKEKVVTAEQVKTDVERVLSDYYDEQIASAERIDERFMRLWKVIRDVQSAGGKRMRPYLMLLAYNGADGQDYDAAVHVAAAIEILHAALLMHDDIVDRDYVRHGRPNVAGEYRNIYHPRDGKDDDHYANGAALLAGDLALSSAYRLILHSPLQDKQRVLAAQLLAETIFTVGGGQLLDLEASIEPIGAIDTNKIALYKTSGYSFVSPLVIGAKLAGADEAVADDLTRYGEALGIAFQLSDDILGLFGDEAVTGKSSVSDLSEGKPTYLMQQALAASTPEARTELLGILGNHAIDDAMADRARELVIASGARTSTEALIDEYARKATAAIATLQLKPDCIDALKQLVDHTARRAF